MLKKNYQEIQEKTKVHNISSLSHFENSTRVIWGWHEGLGHQCAQMDLSCRSADCSCPNPAWLGRSEHRSCVMAWYSMAQHNLHWNLMACMSRVTFSLSNRLCSLCCRRYGLASDLLCRSPARKCQWSFSYHFLPSIPRHLLLEI
jgi:hypothetical protein